MISPTSRLIGSCCVGMPTSGDFLIRTLDPSGLNVRSGSLGDIGRARLQCLLPSGKQTLNAEVLKLGRFTSAYERIADLARLGAGCLLVAKSGSMALRLPSRCQLKSRMGRIRTSGSMSGEGKRGDAEWPKLPRPSSTLLPRIFSNHETLHTRRREHRLVSTPQSMVPEFDRDQRNHVCCFNSAASISRRYSRSFSPT